MSEIVILVSYALRLFYSCILDWLHNSNDILTGNPAWPGRPTAL